MTQGNKRIEFRSVRRKNIDSGRPNSSGRCSKMVKEVPTNPFFQRHYTFPQITTTHDGPLPVLPHTIDHRIRQITQEEGSDSDGQFGQVTAAINKLQNRLNASKPKTKLLQWTTSSFQRLKLDVKWLRTVADQPHQNKFSEEEILFFSSTSWRSRQMHFGRPQKLKLTPLWMVGILGDFCYSWAQLEYDPATEAFNDFLKKLRNVEKQDVSKADEHVRTFLFGELPIERQQKLNDSARLNPLNFSSVNLVVHDSLREIQESMNLTGIFEELSNCYRKLQESIITIGNFEIFGGTNCRVIYFSFQRIDRQLVKDCREIVFPSSLNNFLWFCLISFLTLEN